MAQEDQQISKAIDREYARLRNFIRRRVADQFDAEDILQDVFYELIEAYRMMRPIEQVTAWLFRVARNRIIDLFRKKTRETRRSGERAVTGGSQTVPAEEELLLSPDAGPEAAYARSVLLEELDEALDELPEEQRQVFVDHELMGHSFKELAAQSGVSVNALILRKHYAVRHLRERLQEIYDEFLRK
ncbi:MAG TPA: sigma-70 family RNA polymerase sigma factor [Candidatus Acidoferrum sp.]|nr:sigma-70 family RNA polymerase sigma factor [Candidatus Acidoferrum sp.]